ncbi:ABC transporter ATP-binding protein [Mesorhizobium sp. M1A.T.Ca.IN.004.03.1.1]|nr:ABC transporter ATP-binding protein [Mesorhizobium sp. M1A.T.Ca.IN.004.03.1.1]RUV41275.1 ABC transporter ATP-binding protein [Mesorhizobium sp. M1A.T.Ca.IN.004.03.1.1]
MSVVLQICDLVAEASHGSEWNTILHGVSLAIRRGEVLGLIGESGSGKTTLGLAAMGYAKPGCRLVSGSVTFDGKDLLKADAEELRIIRGQKISYVAQSAAASFNPAHRIVDQFAEVAAEHGIVDEANSHRRAKELFRQLDLPDPEGIGFRYPHQISGGQLQRCMVAMAMACNPKIIVFDEPTTALDVTTQVEFLHLVKRTIRDQGLAAIYISHDLAVVAQVADNVVILRQGAIVEKGTKQQIIDAPEAEYTRRLISARAGVRVGIDSSSVDRSAALLAVEDLSVSYGLVKAVANAGIEVFPRETVSIIGESGSGKTTLAKAIVGLLSNVNGTIVYRGSIVPPLFRDRSKKLLQKVQLVSQSPDSALNPRHTVGRVLARPLSLYFGMRKGEREARIRELLRMVELPPNYADRSSSKLSGGEKQRVCIARALAAVPELVICDEVTSALDPLIAKDVLLLLRKLQNELGLSLLFITHDLVVAEAISHRIVVMRRGQIVEQGNASEVMAAPREPYTQLLIDAVPQMDTSWLDRFSRSKTAESRKLHLCLQSA